MRILDEIKRNTRRYLWHYFIVLLFEKEVVQHNAWKSLSVIVLFNRYSELHFHYSSMPHRNYFRKISPKCNIKTRLKCTLKYLVTTNNDCANFHTTFLGIVLPRILHKTITASGNEYVCYIIYTFLRA